MPRRVLTDEAIATFRERLIDAAERLFANRGIEAVTMRELAAALGVSPMTPYRYFADKDAILAAVRARAFNRHAAALEAAFEAAPDPVSALGSVGRAYVDFALAHPDAYRLMFDTRQPTGGDYPELIAAGERSRRTMTRHLEALAAAGVLKGDPDLVGHMYWAALHGPLMLSLSGLLKQGAALRTLIGALTEAVSRKVFAPSPGRA